MVFLGSYFVIRTKNITSKEGIQKTKTNILGSVKIISISFDCLPPCGRRSMHRLAFPLVMLRTGPCGFWVGFALGRFRTGDLDQPWWHYSSRLWALASEVDLDLTKPIWPSCVICSNVIVEVALVEFVRYSRSHSARSKSIVEVVLTLFTAHPHMGRY